MKNKKQFLVVNMVLVSTLLLSACGNNKKNEDEVKNNKTDYVEKNKKYVKDNTTEVLIDSPNVKKEDITKIIKHGDHWHIFTKDGKEHITYTDPTKTNDNNFSLVSVVSLNQLKGLNIASIKVHGDHWHVYTSDGREFLTYENPSSLFSNLAIEEYVGSHSPVANPTTSYVSNPIINEENKENKDEVIKILVHGDHYHIYTASGKEFVSYSDPRHLYPNAEFGVYAGSHENHNKPAENSNSESNNNSASVNNSNSNSVSENNSASVNNSNSSSVNENNSSSAGSENNNSANNNNSNSVNNIPEEDEHSGLISVLSADEIKALKNITKILKHNDHYHIYTADKKEYITYADPSDIFSGIGDYADKDKENNNVSDKPTENISWPSGITKIVDHSDHWHLYAGSKEVAVVKTNPKEHYPDAEYILEDDDDLDDVHLNENEIIRYEDVEERLVESVIPYLSTNLKAMTNFGNLENPTSAVFGSNGATENIFYWLHGDHYHAESLIDLIKKVKEGTFGNNSAEDVIATMKYIVNHPDNKEEYLRVKIKLDVKKIQRFLMKAYNLDASDVFRLGNSFDVYKNGQTKTFNISEFTEENNEIKYINGELPQFKEASETSND
ncbi:hypothetical protein [Gemella sp. zg-1178]|uniref:hypothetical protein n=1 Tax=Gemella sp. zg-1178 TaxID=2840372 RepID=UPI001C04B417|nr:hypothetical protein [Gemella sp. zg-1178]MBU0279002.1 hypothetical protein [Gemella sp. zg-1178]